MSQNHKILPPLHFSEAGKILIIGNPLNFHVGAHFQRAAQSLGFDVKLLDMQRAFAAPRLLRTLYWRLGKRRPPYLRRFSREVLALCHNWQPQLLLTTGIAPLTAATVEQLHELKIYTANFLTDDPWNPAHQTAWFTTALPQYKHVFSPRKSTLADLHQLGCTAFYLPFAYDPTVHQSVYLSSAEMNTLKADVMFAGGADPDRIPIMRSLIGAGFDVALYGGYWQKDRVTRKYTHSHADLSTLCKAVAAAKVTLCLVRRANRDGHVMRSFELPAMKGCMLVEDTSEHRELFGTEGETVLYFSTLPEMIEKTRWLLDHPDERKRLATQAHHRITQGRNTYRDRLEQILELAHLCH